MLMLDGGGRKQEGGFMFTQNSSYCRMGGNHFAFGVVFFGLVGDLDDMLDAVGVGCRFSGAFRIG